MAVTTVQHRTPSGKEISVKCDTAHVTQMTDLERKLLSVDQFESAVQEILSDVEQTNQRPTDFALRFIATLVGANAEAGEVDLQLERILRLSEWKRLLDPPRLEEKLLKESKAATIRKAEELRKESKAATILEACVSMGYNPEDLTLNKLEQALLRPELSYKAAILLLLVCGEREKGEEDIFESLKSETKAKCRQFMEELNAECDGQNEQSERGETRRSGLLGKAKKWVASKLNKVIGGSTTDKSEPELTLEQIIASMKKSNEDVNDSIRYGVLRQRHDKTIKRFKSASKHMRADTSIINEWSPNAIRKWATSFTEYREKRTLPPSQQSLDASFKGKLLPESERKRNDLKSPDRPLDLSDKIALLRDDVPEMVAVTMRACELAFKKTPRMTQLLSLFALLDRHHNKGRLLQVETGEGKSIVCAMLAVILALFGETVDIVTSSRPLAVRDANEHKQFFELFGLSCAHNADDQSSAGPMECYKANVVYGDMSSFQSHLLHHEFHDQDTRSTRKFGCIIVDEVDFMFIDCSPVRLRLSGNTRGMEYLLPLMIAMWNYLKQLQSCIHKKPEGGWSVTVGPIEEQDGKLTLLKDDEGHHSESKVLPSDDKRNAFLVKNLVDYARDAMNSKIKVPEYLRAYADARLEKWANSAVSTLLNEHEDELYVIKPGDNGRCIVPVDVDSTGVIQSSRTYVEGRHQFLQMKHRLRLEPDDPMTCFMSTLAFFKRYGSKIYGVTGTLGSPNARQWLSDLYKVDLVLVPTYKKKRFVKLPTLLAADDESWKEEVVDCAIRQLHNVTGKAVLIIVRTIKDAKAFRAQLKKKSSIGTLHVYISDDTDKLPPEKLKAGDILLSTNLAGRGADIRLKDGVQLHVIVTFLPRNQRVQDQAFGRTARQGQKGTAQMVLNRKVLRQAGYEEREVAQLVQRRDANEARELDTFRTKDLPLVDLEDEIFDRFCTLSNDLRSKLKPELQNLEAGGTWKQLQLQELWGLKLAEMQDNVEKDSRKASLSWPVIRKKMLDEYTDFEADVRRRYETETDLFENPAYLVNWATDLYTSDGQYATKSIRLLEKAASMDESFAFAAYYNLAYAKMTVDYNGKRQLDEAAEACKKCIESVEGVVFVQWLWGLVSFEAQTETETSTQIKEMLTLLQRVMDTARAAVEKIEERQKEESERILPGEYGVKARKLTLREAFPIKAKRPLDREMLRLEKFGVQHLFETKLCNWTRDLINAGCILALAAGQITLGVLSIKYGGATGGVQFGKTLIRQGVSDVIKSIRVAFQWEEFSWKSYAFDKCVSYGVELLAQGCAVLAKNYGNLSSVTLTCDKKLATSWAVAAKQSISVAGVAAVGTILSKGYKYAADSVLDNWMKNDLHREVQEGVRQCLEANQQSVLRILAEKLIDKDVDYGESRIATAAATILQTQTDWLEFVGKILAASVKAGVNEIAAMSEAAVPQAAKAVVDEVVSKSGEALMENVKLGKTAKRIAENSGKINGCVTAAHIALKFYNAYDARYNFVYRFCGKFEVAIRRMPSNGPTSSAKLLSAATSMTDEQAQQIADVLQKSKALLQNLSQMPCLDSFNKLKVKDFIDKSFEQPPSKDKATKPVEPAEDPDETQLAAAVKRRGDTSILLARLHRAFESTVEEVSVVVTNRMISAISDAAVNVADGLTDVGLACAEDWLLKTQCKPGGTGTSTGDGTGELGDAKDEKIKRKASKRTIGSASRSRIAKKKASEKNEGGTQAHSPRCDVSKATDTGNPTEGSAKASTLKDTKPASE